MSRTTDIDVIVIGAGPAGAAAGMTLARAGVATLVLDRASFPRHKTCGDAVSNDAARLVDGLTGEADTLTQAAHALVTRAITYFPDGTEIARSYGDDPGYIVPRFVLDDLLVKHLTRSGVTLRQGTTVRNLLRKNGAVVGVQLGSGQDVYARAVIAADGPGSVAWRSMGWKYRRDHHLALAITGYFSGLACDAAEHHFADYLSCGYGWIFPEVDGLANVGIYQRADKFHAAGVSFDHLLDRFISDHADRFANASQQGKRRTWSLPIRVTPWVRGAPGLFVVGDAAHCVDPLSGEGIWQALQSGILAAEEATALVHGRSPQRALLRYRLRLARKIGVPSMRRLMLQEGIQRVLDRGLYRSPLIQRCIRLGYNAKLFEMSKALH